MSQDVVWLSTGSTDDRPLIQALRHHGDQVRRVSLTQWTSTQVSDAASTVLILAVDVPQARVFLDPL